MASKATTLTVSIVGDISRLQSSMSEAQRRVQMFGVVATAALVKFGVDSTKAFAEREMAQQKLDFALEKSANLSHLSAQALGEYNAALAEKTAIDDDVIASAQAVLTRFSANEEQLKTLTELSLDYARVTGQDVTTAAGSVGKAIMGNTRALKALGINYEMTGDAAKDAANIQELLNEKIGGYAEDYAGTAAGKTQELARQYGELQESIGAALLPMLMKLVDVLTPIINGFNSLPDGVKQATFFIALFGAAAMAVVPRLIAMKAAMVQANISMASMRATAAKTTTSIKGFATNPKVMAGLIALAAALGIVKGEMDAGAAAAKNWEEATTDAARLEALNAQLEGNIGYWDSLWSSGNVVDFAGALVGLGDNSSDAAKNLGDLGYTQEQLMTALEGGPEAWATLTDSIMASADAAGMGTTQQNLLKDTLGEVEGAYIDGGSAAESAAAFTGEAGEAAEETGSKMDKLAAAAERATKAWQKYVGINLDVAEAEMDVAAGADELRVSLKENGGVLDDNTKAGQANQEALIGQLRSLSDLREARIQDGMSVARANKLYNQQVDELWKVAKGFGITKAEARKYIGELGRIPKTITTDLVIQRDAVITGTTRVGQKDQFQAYGGYISGPGGPRDDLIPAWLSNGEYVIQASAVRALGRGFLDNLNRGRVAGFAKGGSAGKVSPEERAEQIRTYNRAVMERLTELVKAAKDQLKQVKEARKDYAGGVASNLMGAMSLSGTIQDGRDNDAQGLLKRFRQQAQKMRRFMGQLNRLHRLGLSRTLLQEVMDMGTDEGSTMARILLQQPKLMRQFNQVYKGVDRASTRFGNAMGDRYYGDRIRKAERDLDRAEAKRARARDQIDRNVVVNVHVAGSVLTDRDLSRVLTPAIREELRKHDRRNGKKN